MYEKCKVLSDTIALEFACGLVAKYFGIQLHYALEAHEKYNALQTVRQVSKEKKIHLEPILLEQTFGVTHFVTKLLIAFARFKSMNLLVERAKRLQATQSLGGSRSQ